MSANELKQLGFKLTGHRMLNETVQLATGHDHDWANHWQPAFLAVRHGEFERGSLLKTRYTYCTCCDFSRKVVLEMCEAAQSK